MSTVRIALLPFYPKMGNVKENIEKISSLIDAVIKKHHPAAVIFPELATAGYNLENLTGLSSLTSQSDILLPLLSLSKQVQITFGAVLKESNQFFNAAFTLSEGKVMSIQKKIYPPTYAMFDELRYFQAGESLTFFQGPLGQTAVLICEDSWHNCLPYFLSVQKTRIVYVISNSPLRGLPSKSDSQFRSTGFWQKMLSVYAVCNQQILVYINRSGIEDGVSFDGSGFVALPDGSILETDLENEVYIFEVDPTSLDRAFLAGGSFQNENHGLNFQLFEEALSQRRKQR